MSKLEVERALYGRRGPKIRATKREVDGIIFDSTREAERYTELKLLQRAGEISKLQAHPLFFFIVNGVQVGRYRPDFSFIDSRGMVRIEDVKPHKASPKTGKMLPVVNREFGLKCKLMEACFGLVVEVVQ